MVGPRQRPPITRSTDDEDSSPDVTWDELGDIMHLARRASMSSQNSPMPTIYSSAASRNLAPDVNHEDDDGDDCQYKEENNDHHGGGYAAAASATAATTASTSQSSGISEPIFDNNDHEQIFTPRQIQNRHTIDSSSANMPTKLNHSLRSSQTSARMMSMSMSRDDDNLRGSDTAAAAADTDWDDLQDEIAKAMKQSMMIGSGGGGSGGGVGAAAFAKNNTSNGNSSHHHHHHDNSSLSSPPSSPPRQTSSTDNRGGGESESGGNKRGGGGGWNCPACTFLNENPLHLVCAICGTAKVASTSGDDDDDNKNTTTAMKQSSSDNNNEDHELPVPSRSLSGRSSTGTTTTASEDDLFAPTQIKNGSFHSQHSKKSTNSRSSSRRKSVSNSGTTRQNNSNNERMFAKSASFGGRHSSRRYNDPHNNSERLYASGTSIGSNDLHASGGSMNLRHSMGSHASSSRNSRRGKGGSTRRKGVRRGANANYSTTSSNTNNEREGKTTTGEIDESLRSSANDSFGSFNSQDQMMHSFKPRGGGRGERGGGSSGGGGSSLSSSRRGSNEPRLHRSVSHTSSSGGASVTSSRSRSTAMSSRSSINRRGGTKGGGSSSSRGRQYRASMSNVDYGHSSSNGHSGHGGGYNSYDDYSGPDEQQRIVGGRIDADSISDSECSELSDEDDGTIYADDKTARTMQTIKTLRVPHGDVTIIYTDVQGSTSLWEADPLAMKKSTDLHDSIIRKCYADHGGYEITTEGDAFNLAFQHPADAIGFALKAQLALYRAKWPEGILNHPDGCDNEKKKFRGFRVRMGMHHGATTSTVHETTGRTIYQGEAVNISKAIEKMSHGGQILTTVETWRTVSGMAEQFLGSPQVMDCGEHLLYDPKKAESAGKKKKRTIFSKRIVQLVPNSLSYDFFAARGGQEVQEGEQPARVCGRVFPPLLSHGQLSTSFLNAPYIGNKVAMVFVYTDKMESVTDKERKKNYKILSKYVRSHLMRLSPPGYECQEDKGSWMLAFDRIENGIKFGLDLKEDVVTSAELFGKVDKERAFRIGIHWGPFLSMGPHTVSGHADYFGPIVNRAARVAAQCEAGQVCVGVPMGDGEEPPDPGPSVDVDVLGVKQLKGISIEMAIFACKKRKSKS